MNKKVHTGILGFLTLVNFSLSSIIIYIHSNFEGKNLSSFDNIIKVVFYATIFLLLFFQFYITKSNNINENKMLNIGMLNMLIIQVVCAYKMFSMTLSVSNTNWEKQLDFFKSNATAYSVSGFVLSLILGYQTYNSYKTLKGDNETTTPQKTISSPTDSKEK